VGRRAEFAELEQVWAQADDGQRQLVFVGGEPGAGKSRLVAEASRSLQRVGAAVLVGHCLSDSPVAYQPFREPIRALMGAVDECVEPERRAEVRWRLGSLTGAGSSPGPEEPSGQARDHFDALVAVLSGMARLVPVALVLEDLHWSTTSTQQLLTYLVTHLTEARLMVLATHRPTPPDRSEAVVATITELYRSPGVHRLDLSGLTTSDVTDFVRLEAGLPADRAKPLASQLRDETGGNPFFLQEVCRDLRAEGADLGGRGALRVPRSVSDSFSARLTRLDDVSREVVELAAVQGERVSTSVLVSASPFAEDDTIAAVAQAVASGLLGAVPASVDYRFPHALARQAVLEAVPPVRRARHHARVASAMEERWSGGLTETQQIANHYRQAFGARSTGKAHSYLMLAADMTERALAHEEAARYYQQAAELSKDAAERHEALLLAARCFTSSGGFSTAMDISQEIATETGDAREGLAAAIEYEHAARHFGVAGAVPLLTDALRELGADYSDPRYLRGLASLSRALAFVGAMDEAVELNDATLARARALEDPQLIAHALDTGQWSGLSPERVRVTLERATELGTIAKSLRQYHMLGSSGFFRCTAGYMLGRRADLDAGAADMRLAHERSGLPYFDFWSASVDYGLRFISGDFAGAAEAASEGLRISGGWRGDDTEGLYGFQIYMIRRETRDLDLTRRVITGSEDPRDHWAPGLLAVYCELGLTDSAARVLAWLLDGPSDELRNSSLWPVVLGFITEAGLLLGDEAVLRRVRPMLAEYRGLNLLSGQFVGVLGSADRYLGCVDAALATADPLTRFDAAEELDRRSGSRLHLATTLAVRSRYLATSQSAGDRRKARLAADEARDLAEPIGAQRVLAILDHTSAVHAGAGRRGLARPAGGGAGGLTERELDVMRLLIDGLSNQEIAGRLIISPHTAANHVRSILTKTGAANRTQAAMTALSQGWVRAPGSSAGSRSQTTGASDPSG
jgi:DNA-binding CsgD family transcriptional regulator